MQHHLDLTAKQSLTTTQVMSVNSQTYERAFPLEVWLHLITDIKVWYLPLQLKTYLFNF